MKVSNSLQEGIVHNKEYTLQSRLHLSLLTLFWCEKTISTRSDGKNSTEHTPNLPMYMYYTKFITACHESYPKKGICTFHSASNESCVEPGNKGCCTPLLSLPLFPEIFYTHLLLAPSTMKPSLVIPRLSLVGAEALFKSCFSAIMSSCHYILRLLTLTLHIGNMFY